MKNDKIIIGCAQKCFVFILMMVFVSFALFGCGKSSKENESTLPTGAANQSVVYDGSEIIWLVPGLQEEPDVISKRINEKLEQDGYSYRVRFMCVEADEGYNVGAPKIKADIAVVGLDGSGILSAKAFIERGDYICLDSFLDGSSLKTVIPEAQWQSVEVEGKHYSVPNCALVTPYECLWIDTTQINSVPEDFWNGDPEELRSILPNGGKVCYACGSVDFMTIYDYLVINGIVFTRQGKIENPFLNEEYLSWMKFFNELYANGQITREPKDDWAIMISSSNEKPRKGNCIGIPLGEPKSYNGRVSLTTGIRSDSSRQKEAFELLQLVYTDPSYGNLLVYGTNNPEEVDINNHYEMTKLYFGLNDFLIPVDGEVLEYFATVEERMEYYDGVECYKNTPLDKVLSHSKYQELSEAYADYDVNIFLSEKDILRKFGSVDKYRSEMEETKVRLSKLYDEIAATLK